MDNVIIYDKLEKLNEGIESNGGGITSLLGKGCVKSVQRGNVYKSLSSSSSAVILATVSPVNAQKSIVLMNISGYTQSNLAWNYISSDFTFDGSNILMSGGRDGSYVKMAWQVVEFY